MPADPGETPTLAMPPAVKASTAAGPPEYAPVREVRFAVVMYGGVSLAIYIYGVAQELLNLVKATAPAEPGSSDPGELAFGDEGTIPVYRKLARLVGAPSGADPAAGPVRVRFVVDLLTGSSAGGLNAVCLAAALANDAPGRRTELEPLEQLWVEEGDLERLLADAHSALDDQGATDPRLVLPATPPSLLNGKRFFKLMAETLHDRLAHEPAEDGARSRLVDQLDLWVTVTDLDGRIVSVPIRNATVSERQHGYRFHFVYDPEQERNDFTRQFAAFLAFAGRSTSSFPVAFEPMRLESTLPFGYGIGERWPELLYRDYDPAAFQRVPLSDGGILDNKPFSYATQELARRPSTLPVDRYLVYVEPDPKEPGERPAQREWDALDTALAAATGIPRSEAIRGDLELVRRRNRAIRRARRLLSEGELSREQRASLAAIALRVDRDEWRSWGFARMVAEQQQFGPTFPAYHRLKVGVVCDWLARVAARALGVDGDEEQLPKLRAIVDRWKRDRFVEEPAEHPGDQRSETELLYRYDIPFRIRRLGYVLTRLRDLESGDPERIAGFFEVAGCAPPAELDAEELRRIRAGMSDALRHLVGVEDALALERSGLRDSLARSGVDLDLLAAMDGDTDEALALQAPTGIGDRGEPFDVIVYDAVREATGRARTLVERTLGPRVTARAVEELPRAAAGGPAAVVRFLYDAYEGFDLVYLPLSYETEIAETNPISIVRISPRDAHKPTNVSRTLMGAGLHHFAAFADASWRRHDIAWGRLNAAEILIRNLLPDDHPHVERLVDEAHAIIAERYRSTAEPVPGRETTAVGDLGLPLLAGAPVTARLPVEGLLGRGARIAASSARGALEDRGQATAAHGVDLVEQTARGAGIGTLLAGLARLLPTWARVAVLVGVLALVVLAVVLAAAGYGAAAGFLLGALAGSLALAGAVVWYAARRVRAAVRGALARITERPELRSGA